MNYHKTITSIAITVLFACTTDVQAQEPVAVDSSFVREVEALIAEHDRNPKSKLYGDLEMMMASEEAWRKKSTKDEMSMEWTGWTSLVKGAVHAFTQRKYYTDAVLYENRHFSKQDYAVAITPVAATWALKSLGVKSKSSWNRLIVSNSMALAIHVGATQALKHTVKERRPNGENDQSFPSGHTSLAYMSATILSREYGHLSPWVSIGGYGCATATQFMRMRHNSHWVHDTFVGAGIGMMSANLGYFLTDKILGEREIETLESREAYRKRLRKMQNAPSGIRFMMGTEWGTKHVETDNLEMLEDFNGEATVHLSTPYSIGLDASWFLTPNFAIEGLARISTSHAKVDLSGKDAGTTSIMGKSISMYHADIAAKFSIPQNMTKRMSGRLMAGVRNSQPITFERLDDNSTTPFLQLPEQTRFEVGAGMSIDILNSRNHSAGVVVDYFHTFTNIMPDRLIVASSWKAYF
ncbi:MAG: phosphatase PAP2 family protein [Bacteroidaceae bacterium]|nr:phosphatase PAP2 family protein [Bacteroidaceae bacterium]